MRRKISILISLILLLTIPFRTENPKNPKSKKPLLKCPVCKSENIKLLKSSPQIALKDWDGSGVDVIQDKEYQCDECENIFTVSDMYTAKF